MLSTRKVQRLLYELFAYYAIFIGVTSYRYDYKQQRYMNTKWTQLIASLSNVCIMLLICWNLSTTWSSIIIKDEATEFALILDTTINNLICLLRVVQRVPRERATSRIAQELRRMRHIYRYSWILRDMDELHLHRIYLARNFIMWAQTGFLTAYLMAVYQFLVMPLRHSWWHRWLVMLFVLTLDGMDVTMHLYFLLIWRIFRLFERLNKRIVRLIKGNSAVYTLELHHLCWQHWQLSDIMQRLTAAYGLNILSFRFSLIVSAAALGYYISVFRSLSDQLIGLGLYVVFALNGYTLNLMFDWTTQSHRQTLWLLREQLELRHPDAQLSKGCDILALQIASFPLKIKVYGAIAGGKAIWLSSGALMSSWMIVLLQYRMLLESKN